MYLTVFWTLEAFSVELSDPKVLLSMKTARIFGSQASGDPAAPSACWLNDLRACMQQACQPPACMKGGTSSWGAHVVAASSAASNYHCAAILVVEVSTCCCAMISVSQYPMSSGYVRY